MLPYKIQVLQQLDDGDYAARTSDFLKADADVHL